MGDKIYNAEVLTLDIVDIPENILQVVTKVGGGGGGFPSLQRDKIYR